MGLSPWRCFRQLKNKPYPKSKYNRSVPDAKLRIMNTGFKKAHVDVFPVAFFLYCKASVRISSEALEAARIAANKQLVAQLGKTDYHMQINKVPHDGCRFNKMLSMAGADRLQSGMRKSFGKCNRKAARCKKDDLLITIRTLDTPKHKKAVQYSLKCATTKFPMSTDIVESPYWGFTRCPRENYCKLRHAREIIPQGSNITVLQQKGPVEIYYDQLCKVKAPAQAIKEVARKTDISDLDRKFAKYKIAQSTIPLATVSCA